MMNRLKGSVEKELEAWKNGEEYNEEAEKPKTTSEKPKATSGKRKAKDIENHEDSTPKKRAGGRKKKVVEDEHVGQGQGEIKQEFEIENDMI
jgi:hypothetical protein